MQCVRQFMSGLINYLQNNPVNGIDVVLEAEQEELRGLTYVNVSRQLEKVIQELILRPLHHHLIQEIMEALIKSNKARSAAHFRERVFKEYDRLCSSDNQALVKAYLLDPLIRIFDDIQHTFRPDKKIEGLIKILKTIDEFVQQPQATASSKQTMYAVVLALSSLLVTSTATDVLSPIDVQRLYIEGLMARQYLQASFDGCGCLTDLSCALRYTETMLPSTLCTAEAVLALKNSAIAREHSTFDNTERRRGQSLQPELIRPTWSPPSSKMMKSFTEKYSSQFLGSVKSMTGTANEDLSEDLETLVLVLAVDEEVSKFKLLDFPVRHSLTVRELCNLLARRMNIFDPKEFGLFIHLENDDLPLDDSLRLEQVLQRYARQRTSSNSMDRSYGVTHLISSLPTSSTAYTKTLGRCIPPLSPLRCHKVSNPPCLASFGTGDIDVTCRDGDSAGDLSPLEQKTRNPVDTAARFSFMPFVYRRCSDLLVSSKELSLYCLTSIGGRQMRIETR
ncbi:E3 ubiquitin protein ligase rin2 [Sparganum proliferum]